MARSARVRYTISPTAAAATIRAVTAATSEGGDGGGEPAGRHGHVAGSQPAQEQQG